MFRTRLRIGDCRNYKKKQNKTKNIFAAQNERISKKEKKKRKSNLDLSLLQNSTYFYGIRRGGGRGERGGRVKTSEKKNENRNKNGTLFARPRSIFRFERFFLKGGQR